MKTTTLYKLLAFSLVAIVGSVLLYEQWTKEEKPAVQVQKIEKAGISNIEKILTEQPPAAKVSVDAMKIADEIRTEALKAFNGEKSLPLLTYMRSPDGIDSMTPDTLLNRIEQGEHILVSWKLDPYNDVATPQNYYLSSIKKAASLKLPLVFTVEAPESSLLTDSYFTAVPDNETPAVIGSDGSFTDQLSPFGPDSAWYEAGKMWTGNTMLSKIQQWYPDPPLVVFVSLNEANKLSWKEAGNDFRFAQRFGTEYDDNALRTLIDASWVEKYRQLHAGFTDGLQKEDWKNNVKFISANQLSEDMGMNENWLDTATMTNRYLNIWPLTANGLSIDFSLEGNKNLSTTNSPNVEANNLVYMFEEAQKDNPTFVSMLKLNDDNQISDLNKYKGFAEFALWFLRPDIITKEDNSYGSNVFANSQGDDFFDVLADSVEMIYNNDTLKDFWLNGKLMSNGTSPFTIDVPETLQQAPRWYLLDSDANPSTDWENNYDVQVWSFALENDTVSRSNEQNALLFMQSTFGDRAGVGVTVPGYGDVTVDATEDGAFMALTGTRIDTVSSASVSSAALDSTTQSSEPQTVSSVYASSIGTSTAASSSTSYLSSAASSISSSASYISSAASSVSSTSSAVSSVQSSSSSSSSLSSIASSIASSSSTAATIRTTTTIVCQTGPATQEGHVTDKGTGAGLANVQVNIGGCTTTTDANGFYKLANIAESDRAVVTFSADGYYRNSTIIQVDQYLEGTTTLSSNYVEYALNKYSEKVTQDSQNEIWWRAQYGFGIQIPGGVYTDSKGNAYTGNITISRAYRKSAENSTDIAFAGEYKGKDGSGSTVPFVSYGFVVLNITDASGSPLGVTKGSITLTFPATGATDGTLPLWYYDYDQGLWIEEGSAARQADGTYIGAVSHPGAWSLSKPIKDAPGIFRARIINEDGTPARDVRVYAVGDNWIASDLSTDADGNFEIKVIPDSSFQLKAYHYKDQYEAVYNGTIAAIASGDIVEDLR